MTENTIPQSGQKTISLSDYYTILEGVDWYYEMSDDASVWRRGESRMGEVQAMYKDLPEHKKLYDEYRKHIWSEWKKKPNGDPDYDAGRVIPKPERPKENVMRTGESNG